MGTGIIPTAEIQSFLLMDIPELSGEHNESKSVFPIEVAPSLRTKVRKGESRS